MTTPARQYVRGAPTLLTQLVGRAIRARRLRANLQQRDFAKVLGVAPGAVSEIERKPRTHVTVAMMERYASALGMTCSELVREAEALRCEVHEVWERPKRRARTAAERRLSRALGKALRKRRHASGVQLVAVSRGLGLDPSHVCEHERGLVTPALPVVASYAALYGCTAADVVAEAEALMAKWTRKKEAA